MSTQRLRLLAAIGFLALPAAAADNPPLLYDQHQPEAQAWHQEEPVKQRRWKSRRVAKQPGTWPGNQTAVPEAPPPAPAPAKAAAAGKDVELTPEIVADAAEAASRPTTAQAQTAEVPSATLETPSAPPTPPAALVRNVPPQEPWRQNAFAPPTPEGVENYRRRLEARLLEKYNNIPEFAGKVAKVSVVISKPPETSVDGTMIKADFDQLVYDSWGKRIPALEKEYFVVTFGAEGVRQVRSDPSIRVGLDLEKTYSERAPLAADPFRNTPDTESFAPTAPVRMPAWWRPEYPELD